MIIMLAEYHFILRIVLSDDWMHNFHELTLDLFLQVHNNIIDEVFFVVTEHRNRQNKF